MLFFLMTIFVVCLHPLQKTLILIFFVMFILLELANSSSHWVCYLFALIYFGGVLILFTYISSVVPNFSPNKITLTLPLLLGMIIPFMTPKDFFMPPIENFYSTELPLSFISSSTSSFMIYFLLSMVLLLLIVSISILSDYKSPLRNI